MKSGVGEGERGMKENPDEDSARSGPAFAGLIIAAGLLALAALAYWDTFQLGGGPSYSRVGPATAAKIVAIGLVLLAIPTAVLSWRGGFTASEPYDPAAVALIAAGFGALILIIWAGGGFIPGVTVVFATTATAFGRRMPLIDLAIGFGLAVLIYLVFTKLLTLSLPTGPLERLL
jgi:putative tricarboxylic transport membrane protein